MAFALILVLLVILLCLVLLDMYRRSRNALILQVPGGVRFESQRFSMQVQRQQQELRIKCRSGVWTPPKDSAAQETVAAAPVECTFAVVGIAVEVCDGRPPEQIAANPTGTGRFNIVIHGADGRVLTIPRVNKPVATTFQYFYLQVRHWIDKLEQRLERERVERVRSEEAASQAQQHADLMARLQADMPSGVLRSPEEVAVLAAQQIASWRQAAGFEGRHSAHQVDSNGHVVWFVDLADDGRITLRANKRTLHTTLRGATIEPKAGGLEVGVRDAHWTGENAELLPFLVLKNCTAEERRAWKERMEILRNSLDKEVIA